MSFTYEQRPSPSPLVEAVWRTQDETDGTYLAAADGSWDLIFVTENKQTKLLFSGPSSQATPVVYKTGNSNVGIRFRPGAFMRHMHAKNMVDVTKAIVARSHGFWFNNGQWVVPTFDNADEFIAKITKDGSLAGNTIVMNALAGQPTNVSARTVQRHFLQTTGLTMQYMHLIERANQAVAQLQQGKSILQVVHDVGFADQAHMTRVVKHMSGSTPGDIVRKVQACRLRSINAYGACGEMRVQNIKGGKYDHKALQN